METEVMPLSALWRRLFARPCILGSVASVVPTVVFLGVYLPVVGHGFLSDDFRWVLNSRLESLTDVARLFKLSDGFYRPIVSLTFGLDRLAFGINPRPYGWTNVGLSLITALLIRKLALSFGLEKGSGVLAASLWLLNFHGINLSLLWVCGRTALILAAAATGCAICIVRRRLVWAMACLALALFSKEEAFTLPFVLACWLYILGSGSPAARALTVAKWLLLSGFVITAYLMLRSTTGAMTPATAPSYYQFTFAPVAVLRGALQSADRAVTVSTTAALLGLLLLWPRGVRLDSARRRTVVCAGIWVVGGYGITVFLPVRSTLYSVVPSIGACVGAATLLEVFWYAADAWHRRRALLAGILLPICLAPVYRSRTASVPLADFSSQVLRDIHEETRDVPEGATVVIVDDRRTRINIATGFGWLFNDAVLLTTGRRINMWIDPPVPGQEGYAPPCGSCVYKRLRVVEGRVVPFR
jgi:hypothetical protein